MKVYFTLALLVFQLRTSAQTYLSKLENKSDFQNFSGLPLSDKYGEVAAVKIVYDLKSGQLYFLNGKYFKYHFQFCQSELGYEADLNYFNTTNYADDPNRQFLLANVNYFKSLNVYALEISSVDMMNMKQLLSLYQRVAKATFVGAKLQLLLNSARLQNQKKNLQPHMPLLNPAKVYSNLNYQAISKKSGYGVLKFVNNLELEKNKLSPTDIIVIKETPLYLPKVAGIIVTEFQTPLSHLTILGQNRRIPIAAYKRAFVDPKLKSLAHKKVSYAVLGDTFRIKRAEFVTKATSQQKFIKLEYDLKVDSLVDIDKLDTKSYRFAGNKASNFGILYRLSKKGGFKTPESAFVIPFYFYRQHMTRSKAQEMVARLLPNKALNANKDSLQMYLKAIQEEIENSPVDPDLVRAVEDKIKSLGEYTRMRFRSSTNAEDAKGFSGAGLYSSKTGILNNTKKPIDKAIKDVWASLWSYEAYAERDYYTIDHRDVYMGILVHRSFPDEAVNGVAITKNIYRGDVGGFVVNAQLGDESVVNPESGIVCDQFICYPDNLDILYKNKQTVDIITLSNLNDEKLVMTSAEIQHLANQLELIKKHFYRLTQSLKPYPQFGLDLEFKLQGEKRVLYIKQVRLYND